MGRVILSIAADARAVLHGTLVGRPWWAGPRLVLLFAPAVGLATGSFSVTSPERALLMLSAAVKMPILVLGTTLLCLPGFFVLHLVFGVRRDFPVALRAVLGGQALFAVVLAACAPLIPVWYSATDSKRAALIGVSLLFALGAAVSLTAVRRVYARELAPRRIHRVLPIGWFVLYAFVGIQMGWMLRPFLGSPDAPPAFLREEAFTNGYVVVFDLFFGSRVR